jgi:hypothetical protein
MTLHQRGQDGFQRDAVQWVVRLFGHADREMARVIRV